MVLEDELFDPPEVPARTHDYGPARCWAQPELALALRRADVDMRWFVSLIGEEVEPV